MPISPVTHTSTLPMFCFSISSSIMVITSRAPAATPLVLMPTTTRYFLPPSRRLICFCAFSLSFSVVLGS